MGYFVRTVTIVATGLVGLALFAACSGAYGSLDALEAGPEEASTPDAAPPHDSAALDAADAAADAAQDACGVTGCDCDSDGFVKAACADAGADAAIVDCDDGDPRVHPNQDHLEIVPPSPGGGDWNCNGKVEKLFPTKLSCAAFGIGGGCNAAQGFEGDPECGKDGQYIFCRINLALCEPDPAKTVMRKQKCK